MTNLIKNILWQYGLQILKYLFPLLLVPYLTRVLGTDGYAVYAYSLSFMGIVQTIADFGFMLSGTKKVIQRRNDRSALSNLLGSITQARLLLASALFVGISIVVRFIPLMRLHYDYVVLAYISTILRALLPDFMFQGFEEMGPLTTRYFVSKIVTVCGTLMFVKSPADLLIVPLADIAGGVVSLIWSLGIIKNEYGVSLRFVKLRNVIAELMDSAIYCISNIGTTLVSGFTTFVVGIVLSDSDQIAYWSLAMTTVGAVQALYAPISNSLYPHVVARGDYTPAIRLGIIAAPVLLMGTIAYSALADAIFLLLGGPDYVAGSWVMRALAPILPLSFYSILIGWPVLGAIGKVRALTLSTVMSGVFNAVLLVFVGFSGCANLATICIIRCISEFVLLVSRANVLLLKKREGDHRNHERKKLC